MTSILFTTIVILVSAGAAGVLLRRWEPDYRCRLERFLFRAGIGLGIFAYLMMLLGLLQLYNRWSVPAVLALLLVVTAWGRRSAGKQQMEDTPVPKQQDRVVILILLALGAIGFWALIGALAPPAADDWDSLAYHLAVPKLYLQHGGIYYIPFTSHSNFPFTGEMLYTAALSFGLVPAAKLFHFVFWMFTLLGIFAVGRMYYSARAGAVGALIFAAVPLAVWEATTAYIDLAATFYTLLAAVAVLAYSDSHDRRWVIFAAIAAGLAASTKMTALAAIPLFAVWIFLVKRPSPLTLLPLTQERGIMTGCDCESHPVLSRASLGITPDQDSSPSTVKRERGAGGEGILATRYSLLATLVASPWYIKTWVVTGNPVYPFFYNIFGGRGWNTELADLYRSLQMKFGMGHSLFDFVMAPWNLAIYSERFYDTPGLYVGAVFLVLLPLMVIYALRDRRAAALLLFSAGLGLVWFGLSHQSRYLLPSLALLAVPGGAALCNLQGLRAMRVAGYSVVALSALFTFIYISQMQAGAFDVVTGRETRESYLTRRLDTYEMIEYINRELPKDARIVLLNDTRGFYLERDYFWGDGAHNTMIPYGQISSAEQFVRFLRSIRVTHALVRGASNLPSGHGADLIRSAIDEGCLVPVAESAGMRAAVYEVKPK